MFWRKRDTVSLFLSVFQNVMYDSTHSNVMPWDNTDLAYTLFMNCNTVSLCRLWEMINDYKGSRFISECQRGKLICRQFVKETAHWAWILKCIINVCVFELFREDRCSNTDKVGHKEHIQIYNLAYITVCFRTIALSYISWVCLKNTVLWWAIIHADRM